jgi:hypothetical protein
MLAALVDDFGVVRSGHHSVVLLEDANQSGPLVFVASIFLKVFETVLQDRPSLSNQPKQFAFSFGL